MAIQYVRHWEDREHVFPPISKTKLGKLLPDVLSSRGGGPYEIKVIKDGERDPDWSAKRERADTVERALQILDPSSPLDVGDRIRIRDAGKHVFRIIIAESAPELPSGADRWHPLLRDVHGSVYGRKWKRGTPSFLGAEHCRANTRDPSLWSMRSNWPPVLAMDIGVSSLPLGDEINAHLGNEPTLKELIVVWRQPLHFDHLHVQVGGNRSGPPGCA